MKPEPGQMSHRDRTSSLRTAAKRRVGALSTYLMISAVVIVTAMLGCASSSDRAGSSGHPQPALTQTPALPSVASAQGIPALVAQQVGRLHHPVRDAAGAALGPGVGVLIGGVNSRDASVSSIQVVRRATDISIGHLTEPLQNPAAVSMNGALYLVGQGRPGARAEILRVDPRSGRTEVAGRLPQPRSAPATVVVGKTVYLIGGYDGRRRWTRSSPGGRGRTLAPSRRCRTRSGAQPRPPPTGVS
jgi:hypothetical protein